PARATGSWARSLEGRFEQGTEVTSQLGDRRLQPGPPGQPGHVAYSPTPASLLRRLMGQQRAAVERLVVHWGRAGDTLAWHSRAEFH
ncbi:MAG: hypothetical protein ACKOGA_16735, partial [Planctomycetaceae bacterium]